MAVKNNGNEDMNLFTSRIAALEELLDVYEKSVLEQADKLYKEIAERKRTEDMLQEQMQFTNSLIEGSAAATIVIDNEHKILLWNTACEKLTGKSAKEMIGTSNQWQPFYDYKRPIIADLIIDGKSTEDLKQYYDTFSKSLLKAAGLHAEGWYTFLGKKVYVAFDSSPIVNASGIVIAAIETLHDMTQLKMAEEDLARKNMEIEKTNNNLKSAQSTILHQEKMASIGQLAAGVAHEINNPTGYILSNLNSLGKYADRYSEYISILNEAVGELADSGEKDVDAILDMLGKKRKALKLDYVIEDTKQLIRETTDGAEKIKRIVQDLKSFSHVDDTEFKTCDINEGLESTVNIAWNELKYKATVKREYGEIPMVKCNLGQLNQVFINLLVNAAQAIEKQGEITVKTWFDGKYVNVSITDTGSGIPNDKIDRIFEPFFTTKEVGKGTGLGLSIAYDIIKKHAGEIEVASEVGKGTTFKIKIPVSGD